MNSDAVTPSELADAAARGTKRRAIEQAGSHAILAAELADTRARLRQAEKEADVAKRLLHRFRTLFCADHADKMWDRGCLGCAIERADEVNRRVYDALHERFPEVPVGNDPTVYRIVRAITLLGEAEAALAAAAQQTCATCQHSYRWTNGVLCCARVPHHEGPLICDCAYWGNGCGAWAAKETP